MYCRECGARNPDDADRCENCGAPLAYPDSGRADRDFWFRRTEDQAPDTAGTAALVLGIGSLMLLFVVGVGNIIGLALGTVGVVLGAKSASGRTGRILSILGVVLNGIVIGIFVGGGIALVNCVGL